MEQVLADEPLIQYFPTFQRTGFTDTDFVLNEDVDGWQVMLDAINEDLVSQGLSLKPGHRMMILSRLKKAKIELERNPEESRERKRSPSPTGLVKAPSSEDDSAQQQMSSCATFLDGFAPLLNIPTGWRLALALALLSMSLLLWVLYRVGANQVGSDVAGGWLFVKVVYITGFVVSGMVTVVSVIHAIHLQQQQAAPASNAPALSLPDCTGCTGMFGCALLESIQCPSCDLGVDCSKIYKIVCCQCSIQID